MNNWKIDYNELINKWSRKTNFRGQIDMHPFFQRVHYSLISKCKTLRQFKKQLKESATS